jgi:P-type Cu+ transporter
MTLNQASKTDCDYCGLPLPATWWKSQSESDDDQAESVAHYCCFGCRFAASVTQESGEEGAARWTLTRLGIAIFFTMNVMVFTMVLWSYDVYDVNESDPFTSSISGLFRYLCLLFSLPVLFLLGKPLLENAISSLNFGYLSTDFLLVFGVLAAYFYSAVSVFRGSGHVYFEVGCMVLVMITLGRWIEATGKLKASQALDALQKLLPESVTRIVDQQELSIPLDEVQVGDVLRILPGERFPTDAIIVNNSASVDEQIFTGESQAVYKSSGDTVLAGTLNLDGDLMTEVSASPYEGAFSRLVELVKQARETKGKYQNLADRVSTWFLPVVLVCSVGTFLFHSWNQDIQFGLLAGLSVVLIACPCALGLATPLAVWTSLGHAASNQVLFRYGHALEQLADLEVIRFDKTGTLTTGVARVVSFTSIDSGDSGEILTEAKQLASSSTHVYSEAISQYEVNKQLPAEKKYSDVVSHAGLGMSAWDCIEKKKVFLGSRRFMEENGLVFDQKLEEQTEKASHSDHPIVLYGDGNQVKALFLLDEDLRPEVNEMVSSCRELNLDMAVLTGDLTNRAERLSEKIGIPVFSELLPDEKMDKVKEAKDHFGCVAMVGDGVNDAPALAASDIGIAMGCGTDVSRESAAVCLLSNDLRKIPWSINLARKTKKVVIQNLAWAFGYNIFGMSLAISGTLNPAIAALLMMLSSLFVISNSLRLAERNEFTGLDSTNQNRAERDSKDSFSGFTPDVELMNSQKKGLV